MTKAQPQIYQPRPAKIQQVITENSMIKTFVLRFQDEGDTTSFQYQPGQFMMVSVPHCGEAPISFSSTPSRPGTIHFSVRRAGRLTAALHGLVEGDVIGLRGPYGRPFPLEQLQDRNLLVVAGGIGLAPLKSVIDCCLDKQTCQRIMILYGSRTPSDIAFRTSLDRWATESQVQCRLTVDVPEPGWGGPVGVVTTLLDGIDPQPAATVALVCGPPLMIRVVVHALSSMGLADESIITTMERQMKCGVGICRHCHMGHTLVCTDGPVYSLAELKRIGTMEVGL